MDQDRLADAMAGFELSEELVEIVDIPRPVDLRQHDDVELASDRRNDLGDVVKRPGRSERVDARPQSGCAEIIGAGKRNEAPPRRFLGERC